MYVEHFSVGGESDKDVIVTSNEAAEINNNVAIESDGSAEEIDEGECDNDTIGFVLN